MSQKKGLRQAYGKKNPNLPFHPAVRAGDFIFVSGQVAKDAEGNMVSGTKIGRASCRERVLVQV